MSLIEPMRSFHNSAPNCLPLSVVTLLGVPNLATHPRRNSEHSCDGFGGDVCQGNGFRPVSKHVDNCQEVSVAFRLW